MTLVGTAIDDVVATLTASVKNANPDAEVSRGFIDGRIQPNQLPKVWVFPDRSTTGQAITTPKVLDLVLVGCVARGDDELDKMLALEQACTDGLSSVDFRNALKEKGIQVEAVGSAEYIPPEVHQDALSFVFTFALSVSNFRRSRQRGG